MEVMEKGRGTSAKSAQTILVRREPGFGNHTAGRTHVKKAHVSSSS